VARKKSASGSESSIFGHPSLRWSRTKLVRPSGLKFELYFHPKQKEQGGWVGGFEFDKHLRETSRFECTRSLEDEEVKGWLENPETYPEEYRNKAIFLWKSLRDSGDVRYVAYLVWFSGRVFVRWRWLEGGWCGYDPVLLASSSDV